METLDPKLGDLTTDGNFRAKVQAVLADVSSHGERPKIFETARTEEQQREKVRLGYSKTMNSYHRKRGKDGKALAADVAEARKGWNARRRFWFMLGASARAHGVGWGGLFNLKRAEVHKLLEAFSILRAAGWPPEHPAYQTRAGWDVAHLQKDSNWTPFENFKIAVKAVVSKVLGKG